MDKIHLLFVTIASDINEQEHILTMKQGEAIQDLSGGNRLWIVKSCLLVLSLASSFPRQTAPSSDSRKGYTWWDPRAGK